MSTTNVQQGLLDQWELVKKEKGFAWGIGAGACIPPLIGFYIVHIQLKGKDPLTWWQEPAAYVLAFCLAFSVSTVYEWGVESFDNWWKPVFLVGSLEGAMVFGDLAPALASLCALLAINAIATACVLIRKRAAKPTVQDLVAEQVSSRRESARRREAVSAQFSEPRPA